jgi:glyoxylase-like metal-dependent hydrolase (beta-lactamase superfamily II)
VGPLILTGYVVTSMGENCYIVGCDETQQVAVIDPGGDAPQLLAEIEQYAWKVQYIINTHGHIDHIGGNAAIKRATGAKILIHAADAERLINPNSSLALMAGGKFDSVPADQLLQDGDRIQIGNTVELKVIHTPGHTPGGICLQTGDIIFVGDTLFRDSVGRSDFPGGSHSQLIKSIKERLLTLPDDMVAYPGHGPATTIGYERQYNPFL